LYTVEAVRDYLLHLENDGLLSMIVGDIIYPDTLPPLGGRLGLIAYRALEELGVQNPHNHLMVVAALNATKAAQSQDILVSKQPYTPEQIATIKTFVEQAGFKLLYAPGDDGRELSALLGPDEAARERALDDAWFRMDAVYDRDPFFYNVGKWSNFDFSQKKSLLFLFPGSFIGQVVLLLMIAQSTILGIVLIAMPLLRGAREGLDAPGVVSYLAYFLSLGIGFMFIEISFVQSFVLFLGSPTYALSVTIFALLLFSSLGSFLSSRFADNPQAVLRPLSVFLGILILTYAVGLSRVFEAFLHLDLTPRILIAIAVQIPLGLTLGMFMPLGIATIAKEHPRLVPWAWGINGIGSVVGTTLAVVIAMSWASSSWPSALRASISSARRS
jgi:hypothetical protein